METFTASNGVVLDVDGGAIHKDAVMTVKGEFKDALRDFFQYERDQELGRWRWLGDQKWVVYKGSSYLVINEDRGTATYLPIAGWSDIGTDPAHRAVLAAYEAAHPVPKPWHEAKPGEVWELTYGGCPTAHVFTDRHSEHPDFAFVADRAIVNPDDPDITSGRRIWPEVE